MSNQINEPMMIIWSNEEPNSFADLARLVTLPTQKQLDNRSLYIVFLRSA